MISKVIPTARISVSHTRLVCWFYR